MPAPVASVDVLALGELLVDLIGTHPEGSLKDTPAFDRRPGGSPANLARTVALTGGHAAIVACVGDDGLGGFLRSELDAAGVNTRFVRSDPDHPTSCILLSRSAGTSEFLAYRQADTHLRADQVPPAVLSSARIVHTTAFALSREPARSAITTCIERAIQHGADVSIDVNYAPSIWPDRHEALEVLRPIIAGATHVKVSDDDLARLFGPDVPSIEGVGRLHAWGADTVCLTRGPDGCRVSWDGGTTSDEIPAAPVETVADATGAGDAFWGGFLSARLRGHDRPDAARIGGRIAAQKLASVGPIDTLAPVDGFPIR